MNSLHFKRFKHIIARSSYCRPNVEISDDTSTSFYVMPEICVFLQIKEQHRGDHMTPGPKSQLLAGIVVDTTPGPVSIFSLLFVTVMQKIILFDLLTGATYLMCLIQHPNLYSFSAPIVL